LLTELFKLASMTKEFLAFRSILQDLKSSCECTKNATYLMKGTIQSLLNHFGDHATEANNSILYILA